MNRLTQYLLIGSAAKVDWAQVRKGCVRWLWANRAVWRLTLCGGLLLAAVADTAQPLHLPFRLEGEWVDQALSDTLSEKLGCKVRLQDARFPNWKEVTFGLLEIRNTEGKLLMSADSGAVRLRRLAIRKDGFCETEINLEGARLTREYYGKVEPVRFWSRFLRKTLSLKRFEALILQNDEYTAVQVLDCRSDDVKLEGGVVFERSGAIHDSLRTSMGFWRYLTAVV